MRLAEPLSRGPISTSRALSTAIHRNQQWMLECLGTVAVIRHWCRQVPSGHASSPGGNYGFLRRGAPEPVPGRHTICSRGPWRRPRSPSHPFAISRVSRRQASQTPSRRRASDTLAAPPRRTALGAENNFAHRKPGRDLGVEPTAPGGVPPSPQPLTHPAIRPWPFWPGSSFLGGAARNRRIRGGGLCPPDKPRVLSRVAVATDDV